MIGITLNVMISSKIYPKQSAIILFPLRYIASAKYIRIKTNPNWRAGHDQNQSARNTTALYRNRKK